MGQVGSVNVIITVIIHCRVGIEHKVGIGNVYDPHYHYYTLYGCRDVLRVSLVWVM